MSRQYVWHTEAMSRNVLGGELETCSLDPLTGFFRTGCCDTGGDDLGVHAVCAEVTEEFLAFSKAQGNDLSTPQPGFAGLVPGDRWCLCAPRWQEALDAGGRPPPPPPRRCCCRPPPPRRSSGSRSTPPAATPSRRERRHHLAHERLVGD